MQSSETSFLFSGMAVFFCYLNNVTFYAACLAINERRVGGNRHFLTCCVLKTKDKLRKDKRSGCFVMCCGGQPPKTREEAESLLDELPRWLIPRIVLKFPIKIAIVALFIVYLAAGIYGCIHLKQGLLFTQLLSEDSYYYKYSNIKEEKFARQIPVSFVIKDEYNYFDPLVKDMIDSMLGNAKTCGYINNKFEINWLNTYLQSPYFTNTTHDDFIKGLKLFLNNNAFKSFENDVVFNEVGTNITASRFHVLSRDLDDSQEEGDLMLKARDIADSAQLNCFAYSPLFVLAEQYISILSQSLQSVGIALASVFVITCVFMPHPTLILFVTLAVGMIMVGVVGFMYYVDVALSAITMIHLIMSVGFSIDFTAHICHGYMISEGHTTDLRIKQSVDKTGAPIFHGAVSSLIGIATLSIAKSYAFRTFATVMSFVLVFGIAHALLLLPVLLPWIGPGRLHEEDNGVEGNDAENKGRESAINGTNKTTNGVQMNGIDNGTMVANEEMMQERNDNISNEKYKISEGLTKL